MHLHFLKELTAHPGPFATVYLDASHDTEDAGRQGALRWAAAREELAAAGAGDTVLSALDAAVQAADPPRGRAGRVLVAAGDAVLLDRLLPAPPDRPVAVWGELPDLLPMLLALPEPRTAVVARIGEPGGEILVATAGEDPEHVADATAGEWRTHKVRAGGLAHLNMQERVEESWRRNTVAVAERVDRLVRETGARVLVVAGDAASRSRLRDALSERSAGIAVDVEFSGGGGSDEDLAAAVTEALADAENASRHAAIAQYEQAAGRGEGLAVAGLRPVLAALRAEQVETLLVDGGVERGAEVWFADTPTLVALDAEELRALGAEPHGPASADAALVRAAAGGDAAFVPLGGGRTGLVGHDVPDGVAAVLRHPFVGA